MAPGPSVGGTVGAALRLAWFSLGVAGLFNAPSSAPAGDAFEASTWSAIASILPCASFGPFFGCAVAQAGTLQSRGQDAGNTTRSAATVWGALGGRLGAVLPVTGPLFVRGHVDVLGDLSPTTLTLNGMQPWVAPPVASTLGIDAVVRFR
jgi:hypothetical protein